MTKKRWSIEIAIDTSDVSPFMSLFRHIQETGTGVPDTMVDIMITDYVEEEKESGRVESGPDRED